MSTFSTSFFHSLFIRIVESRMQSALPSFLIKTRSSLKKILVLLNFTFKSYGVALQVHLKIAICPRFEEVAHACFRCPMQFILSSSG